MDKLLAIMFWISALLVVIGAGEEIIDLGIYYYGFAGWCASAAVVIGKDFWCK